MKLHSKVSIITAVYNHERYLAQAIESVLAQEYADWELILWDDGSIDKSIEIARKYAAKYPDKIKFFSHPNRANLGQEATRNAAIEKSSGALLALLDSDDYYESNKLSSLVPCFDNPKVGLAFGRARVLLDASGELRDSGIVNEPSGNVFEPLVWDNFICAGATIFRRECLAHGASFDSRFKTMGEYPLWIRIARDWELCFIPEIVAVWREHGANLGTKLALEAKAELVRFGEEMLMNPLYAESRAVLTAALAKRRYDYAHELYGAGDYSSARGYWLKVAGDMSAPKEMKIKSSVMASLTFLGKDVNEGLFKIKRFFWEKTHPFARDARLKTGNPAPRKP